MKNIKLQAHRGVSSDCPENTMAAFRCAALQGYDVIELDPDYTKDGKIVILHDKTLNRTARKADGSCEEKELCIREITYEDALEYDFGIAASNKFRGEKIPLFKDVLKLAADENIRLKIDNKIQWFPKDILSLFFSELKEYTEYVSVTSNNLDFIRFCLAENPDLSIDYDGQVTKEILEELCSIIPRERLTVWLPYKCEATSWVRTPFAGEELTKLVKKYASLGIWLISDYEAFYEAAERFRADIVETNGIVKPIKNAGTRYDMHTHSISSHDSECKVSDMQCAASKKGLDGFAVTDHCDIEFHETQDLDAIVKASLADAERANENGKPAVLKGIEICEAFWHSDVSEKILRSHDFDAVIGSVHAVRFDGFYMPYSRIDFSEMSRETVAEYLDRYFDDMLVMLDCCDIDILAHMTCPLRYIVGKYGIETDLAVYEEKIKKILRYIISHKIALEVNTSCLYERSGYFELLPSLNIIKMYRDMGGYLITTGSDAHIAENAANGFDTLYSTLGELGFKNIYYYKISLPVQCSIE